MIRSPLLLYVIKMIKFDAQFIIHHRAMFGRKINGRPMNLRSIWTWTLGQQIKVHRWKNLWFCEAKIYFNGSKFCVAHACVSEKRTHTKTEWWVSVNFWNRKHKWLRCLELITLKYCCARAHKDIERIVKQKHQLKIVSYHLVVLLFFYYHCNGWKKTLETARASHRMSWIDSSTAKRKG